MEHLTNQQQTTRPVERRVEQIIGNGYSDSQIYTRENKNQNNRNAVAGRGGKI